MKVVGKKGRFEGEKRKIGEEVQKGEEVEEETRGGEGG